jgi:hypothetical protein
MVMSACVTYHIVQPTLNTQLQFQDIFLLWTVSDNFCNDINQLTDMGNYKMASGIIKPGLLCMHYWSIAAQVVMFEVHMWIILTSYVFINQTLQFLIQSTWIKNYNLVTTNSEMSLAAMTQLTLPHNQIVLSNQISHWLNPNIWRFKSDRFPQLFLLELLRSAETSILISDRYCISSWDSILRKFNWNQRHRPPKIITYTDVQVTDEIEDSVRQALFTDFNAYQWPVNHHNCQITCLWVQAWHLTREGWLN